MANRHTKDDEEFRRKRRSDDDSTMRPSSRRGFAAMDEETQREIASLGGKAAHRSGNAHEFDSEEAREAGRLGGRARWGRYDRSEERPSDERPYMSGESRRYHPNDEGTDSQGSYRYGGSPRFSGREEDDERPVFRRHDEELGPRYGRSDWSGRYDREDDFDLREGRGRREYGPMDDDFSRETWEGRGRRAERGGHYYEDNRSQGRPYRRAS